jgi:hypothetical protein
VTFSKICMLLWLKYSQNRIEFITLISPLSFLNLDWNVSYCRLLKYSLIKRVRLIKTLTQILLRRLCSSKLRSHFFWITIHQSEQAIHWPDGCWASHYLFVSILWQFALVVAVANHWIHEDLIMDLIKCY